MRQIPQLAALLLLSLPPTVATAACTGDLAFEGFSNVYLEGTGDAVVGGIAPNQYGLEITEFCEGDRCLMFFKGLSGFIDVTTLAGPVDDALPLQFAYDVTAMDGALTFMGQTQAFALTGGRPIFVEPQADHVLLRLSPPLPIGVRMESTGSSGREALLPDWVGVPVSVALYLDCLGADEALLEITADHEILKMNMRLGLARISEAPAVATSEAAATTTGSAPYTACQETHALAVSVGEGGDQAQIDAYFAAATAVGITDWDNRSDTQCEALLVALSAAGVGGAHLERQRQPPPVARLWTRPGSSCAGLTMKSGGRSWRH
ncbi:MAG: hypothetical protein MK180_14820 [Rhodobacteraceae bacterium]|nr:hypothetical protein [Paracoccaceae bacterium]